MSGINYSSNEYKRLGNRIRSNPHNISEEDYQILQDLRLTYKEPLAIVFNAIERTAYKVDSNCICTYRVKRIESIVSKLIRFPHMQVNKAEDIAGCRCIMTSTENVYKLYNKLQRNKDRLPFEMTGAEHDYIAQPKESGYQSIHLNVRLKGDKRVIEIQLRALEHHNWATLVEITDLLYRTKLKEYGQKSNQDLFDLHRLLSKDIQELTKEEMYRIVDVAIANNYVETIGEVFARNYLEVRSKWNKLKLQHYHFFLISTDSTGNPDFSGYLYFEEAEQAYFNKFSNNRDNRNIVLTHLQKADFTKISIAYSNYFLTFNNTLTKVLLCLSEAVVNSYKRHQLSHFNRYHQASLNIVAFWINKQMLEMESFRQDRNVRNYLNVKTEWSYSIQHGIIALRSIFLNMHRRLTFNPLHAIPYYYMRRNRKKFLDSLASQK